MDVQEMLAKVEFDDITTCPLCRLPDRMVDLVSDVALSRPSQSWRLCLNCEHTFVSPCPTEAFLSEFYTEGYRRMTHNLKETEDKTRMPVQSVNEERMRAMRVATTILRIRPKVANHLDIGSSTGALCAGIVDFLHPAHSWGVEPGDAWREFAESAFANREPAGRTYEDDVKFAATLSKVPKAQKFELVTIIHTLEHVREPRELLEECRSRMRPTGLLVVEVPHRYGGVPSPLMWPHLHCFTEQTLARLFTETGFTPILTETFGCLPPFFIPPQALLMVGMLKSPVISVESVLARYNQYRVVIGNVQQRMAQARPNYDIG